MKPTKTGYTLNIMLTSAGEESYPSLALSLFGYGYYFKVPQIIKPDVLKVRGKYNYDELISRRYGLTLFENHLSVSYGRGDANFHRDILGDEQRWSCFLPWNEWRFVAHRVYDEHGALTHEAKNTHVDFNLRENMKKCKFLFKDFDGEEIRAETYIEEHEWLRGEGLFKWLSFFWKPKIIRSLDIHFNKETGKRKGSWKGGTIGHGIDMLSKTETCKGAFMRYCKEHKMTFITEVG